VLASIGGLETNRINQIVVNERLQSTGDERIFALGDCASCAWPGKQATIPPRAQAAHQQASYLARHLPAFIRGKAIPAWVYRDFGSLVSLGRYSTVGSLMDSISRHSFMIEGYFARWMYLSLYKSHEYALHGLRKVALDTLARLITRRTAPHIKLH
jgi:NADH dehydrogenase